MDFEDDNSEAEMIPIIPSNATEEASNFYNYPSNNSTTGTKTKLTVEQQAALEDPHEKDILELLQQMDDFDPLIPESLTDYYMVKNGVECDDPRLKKLIALVAQKFISDVTMDAMQYSRMRQASSNAGSSEAARKAASLKQKQTLTMDDLAASLSEHGINIRKPPYHL